MKMRIGIIGCGAIAPCHLAGYQDNGMEVVAFADVNLAAARKLAETNKGGQCYSDHQSLVVSGTVDAVSICSPPVAHEDAVVCALENNIHALCEKPLAHTIESARRIAAAASKSGAIFMPAFRHRFLPAVRNIRDLIRKGSIGPLVYFNNIFCGPTFYMKDSWFSKKEIAGGGALLDTTSHSVDLFRFLVGEVIHQSAVMHKHMEGTNVEDAGVLSLKAENGCVGSLISAWVAGTQAFYIDIMGQKGRLFYDYGKRGELKLHLAGQPDCRILSVPPSSGFKEQISHFLKVISGEEKLSCTAYDGLRSVEIIQATYRKDSAR